MLTELTKLIAQGQLKFESGNVYLLQQNIAMLPIDFITTIQKELEKNENGNQIYLGSKQMGVRWFKNMHEHFNISPEDVVRWGIKVLEVAGWGQTEVTLLDSKEKIMKVKLKNAAQAKEYGESTQPVDHFVRGCYASGAKVIFGGNCDAVEYSCKSQGAQFCEFIAQPTEKFNLSDKLVKRQIA